MLSGGHVTIVSKVHCPARSSKLATQGQEGRERGRRSGKKEKQAMLELESILGRVDLSQTAGNRDKQAFQCPLFKVSTSPWSVRTDSVSTQSQMGFTFPRALLLIF